MKNFFLFPALFVLCLTAFLKAETAERDLFPKDAVILFQGDSVTDGNRGRSADPNHIHGHGYVYLIASYLGAPPWVVFACLKCDQILKCFVAVVKINRYNWMKNLTRESNT